MRSPAFPTATLAKTYRRRSAAASQPDRAGRGGLIAPNIEINEHLMVAALIASGRLTENEALRR
jgi:hypothetical protein